jgi:glycosyltransferase involved in cell wall biosynthesis
MLHNKIDKLKNLIRDDGLFATLRYLLKRTKGRSKNILLTYDYVIQKPFGQSYICSNETDRTINWVIPDIIIGSGGHLNVFRLILMLEQFGFKNQILLIHSKFKTSQAAKEAIRQHFYPINAEIFINKLDLKSAAITVATSWISAYFVRDFQNTGHRCYFVQDYEPYFYPHGSDYEFSKATYNFGFYGITAGNWLADKLSKDHNMQTLGMGFSYDRDLYRPYPKKNTSKKQVFFYARPSTERRGFELGLLTLSLVSKQVPDTTFILAGADLSNYDIPFKHVSAGNVTVKDLPELYSQCDVALVLSLTDLSLLPVELMACGCAVVSNRGENVEWLLNKDNAVLTDSTPEALSTGIVYLLNNEDNRKKLTQSAINFSASTRWDTEAEKVAGFFESLLVKN